MSTSTAGPLHAYLAGAGRDSRGRLITDVLDYSDERLDSIHDYIQWLFPLPTRSAAQPHSPTLTALEIEAIRLDRRATDNLQRAAHRMLRFYSSTREWLTSHDHNHLRITRIIRSLRLLIGSDDARRFHHAILDLQQAAGDPVNADSLRFWAEAAGE